MTREQAKDISNQKIFDILKTYTNMTDRDIRRHISQGGQRLRKHPGRLREL